MARTERSPLIASPIAFYSREMVYSHDERIITCGPTTQIDRARRSSPDRSTGASRQCVFRLHHYVHKLHVRNSCSSKDRAHATFVQELMPMETNLTAAPYIR